MKNIYSLIFLSFIHLTISFGQSESLLPKSSLQITPSFSMDGTDDVPGFSFSGEYMHYFAKKLNWTIGFATTIHDGSTAVDYFDLIGFTSNGEFIGEFKPGTVYYTTAGFQFNFLLGYSIIRNLKHNLIVQLGPLGRYQTSSNPEREGILLTPTVYFERLKNYRTLSFGGIGQLSYSYTFTNNYYVLLTASLQIDSNDDAFNMFGIGVGKRL